MRNVQKLRVGDVVQCSELSKDHYYLVLRAPESAAEYDGTGEPVTSIEMIDIGEDRFQDIEVGRQRRLSFDSIERLGRVRRIATYVRREMFTRT